jgi:hypothetical protein
MQSPLSTAIQRFLANCPPNKAIAVADIVAAVNWMLPGTDCDGSMVEDALHVMIVEHGYQPPVTLISE